MRIHYLHEVMRTRELRERWLLFVSRRAAP